MITASTVRDLRSSLLAWREADETVALVPTMGALHDGHMTLIQMAQKIAKRTVVSIFVNPLQFGANEDLNKYPRPREADQKLLAETKCDLLFMPSSGEMYPDGFGAKIDPGPMAKILEGLHRPGHFVGVATIVIKLLMQAMPDCALFGEKDYQQLLIIRQVTRDLNVPTTIVGVPIARDNDGLALSSRNVYLNPQDRQRAATLPRALREAANDIVAGKDIAPTLEVAREKLKQAGFKIDYVELVNAETLAVMHDFKQPSRLLAAAHIGVTRLIDNIAVIPRV